MPHATVALQSLDHGDLVTAGELGTAVALAPDLAGEGHHVRLCEAELLEESGAVGEGEGGGQADLPRFVEAGLHDLLAQALPLQILAHGQRLDLRQVSPEYVEPTARHRFAVLVSHNVKVAEVLVDLGHRARQHLALAREDVDEVVDRLRVGDLGADQLAGGGVADRVERRKILLRCYSVAAVVSFGYLFLTGFDVRQVWPVFILAAVIGSADAFSQPARMSMAPSILPRAQLQNGIILGTVAFMSAGQMLGPGLAGFISDGPGLKYAFATEVVLLIVAALISTRLRVDKPVPTGKSVFGDLVDGIKFARNSPVILGLFFLALLPPALLMGPTRVTAVFMVRDVWHESDKFIGLIYSAFGVGVIAGSLVLTTIRLRHRGILLTGVSTVLGGLFFAFVGVTSMVWVALGFQLLLGLAAAIFINNATPLLQEQAMGPKLGRVMSMQNLCFAVGQPLGVAQAGIVTSIYGPQTAIVASGAAMLIIGVLAFIFLKPIRNLD